MRKLDMKAVMESGLCWKDSISAHQTAVFVMCGGGLLGNFAAQQPADFYIDDRVGRLRFPRKEIYQVLAVLVAIAKANGLDPHNLPQRPRFHDCGIF